MGAWMRTDWGSGTIHSIGKSGGKKGWPLPSRWALQQANKKKVTKKDKGTLWGDGDNPMRIVIVNSDDDKLTQDPQRGPDGQVEQTGS